MARKEICKNCNGNGVWVPDHFGPFDDPIDCEPCGGDGWIEVDD